MPVIQQLQQATTQEVEAGGVRFRVEAVDTAKLALAGKASLLVIPMQGIGAVGPGGAHRLAAMEQASRDVQAAQEAMVQAAREGDDTALAAAEEEALTAADQLQTLLSQVDDGKLENAKHHEQRMVCAGVVAAFDPQADNGPDLPPGAWERVRVVMGDDEATDAAQGKLHVKHLPPGAVSILARAITHLSQGEGWPQALNRFRGLPAADAPAGQAGAAKRH